MRRRPVTLPLQGLSRRALARRAGAGRAAGVARAARQGGSAAAARAARPAGPGPPGRAARLDAWGERRRSAVADRPRRRHDRPRLLGAGDHGHAQRRRPDRRAACRPEPCTSTCRSTRRAGSARFLDHWQPDLALVAESEIWPNTVLALHAPRDPAAPRQRADVGALVHAAGRAAPRTAKALLVADRDLPRADPGGRRALRPARRAAGERRREPEVRRRACRRPIGSSSPICGDMIGDRPVWVAASTHPGEDAMVARAHAALKARFPRLLTIVAPRHPHRGRRRRGLRRAPSACAAPAARQAGARTRPSTSTSPTRSASWACSTASAPWCSSAAPWCPHGGQNPIEPVRLDAAVLHGPHTDNFDAGLPRPRSRRRRPGGADDGATWPPPLGDLLRDPAPHRRRWRGPGTRALRPFEGAVARTLAVLDPFIAQMKLQRRRRDP